jgi:uncharacterized metal-binding protein YceD (DUF177 family)
MAMFNVHLNDLPPEGMRFVGELRPAVFVSHDPHEEPGPTPSGLTTFDVEVTVDKELVMIEGTVESTFELECCRCAERFPWKLSLNPYVGETEREGRSNLDLTEFLREDILLALPGYPHCEDSSDATRVCPAAGRFASATEYVPISDDHNSGAANDPWAALDDVKERIGH